MLLALLLVACEPLPEAHAKQRALEWAKSLGVETQQMTCHGCTGASCYCDVMIPRGLIPLTCFEDHCVVRVR